MDLSFQGKKNELQIGYLVAEILSKKPVWTLCMHFLIFRGKKRQQFSWKTDNYLSIYNNFPVPELKPFEDDLIEMVKNIEFR